MGTHLEQDRIDMQQETKPKDPQCCGQRSHRGNWRSDYVDYSSPSVRHRIGADRSEKLLRWFACPEMGPQRAASAPTT